MPIFPGLLTCRGLEAGVTSKIRVSIPIEVTGTNGGVLRARLDGLPAADLGTVFRVFGS